MNKTSISIVTLLFHGISIIISTQTATVYLAPVPGSTLLIALLHNAGGAHGSRRRTHPS